MGADKVGSDSIRSSSFFHLLDWSERARKKLFSEGKKQKKQDSHEEQNAVSSEIGEGSKPPGVVARLMGLDSLPTSGNSTPLHNSQLLEDFGRSQISSPEVYNRDDSSPVPMKNDVRLRKPVEMSSRRIERFHIDTLPSKFDRAVPDTHHKLLARVKHPVLGSPKHETFLTGRVTNCLETKLLNGKSCKSLSFRPSSSSPKGFHSRDIASTPKKKSTIAGLATGRTAHPVATGYPKGPQFRRSNIGSEIASAPRSFPDTIDATPGAKFDKSPSLVILSKTKNPRRENLSKKIGDTLMAEDNDKLIIQSTSISSSNSKTVNQQRTSTRNPSKFLRQNNEKQSRVSSKNNLAKPPTSNHQLKSTLSGTFDKKRVSEKLTYGFRKDGLESSQVEKEGLEIKNIKLNQNRRPVTQGSYSSRNVSTGKRPMAGREKHVRHNVVIDEHTRWQNDSPVNVVDVVSFSFTSPIRKSVDVCKTTYNEVKKLDASNKDKIDNDEITSNLDNNDLPSSDSNILSGDSLGKLIERKLLELTSGTDYPYNKLSKGGTASLSGSLMDDSASSAISSTFDAEHDMESLLSVCSDKIFGTFEPNYCLITDDTSCMSHEPQEAESIDSYNTSLEIEELDCEDQFGVLNHEFSFSNRSYYSSESFRSGVERKIDAHSASMATVDTATGDAMNKTISLQSEMEISDSASYMSVETISGPVTAEFSSQCLNLWEKELDYLKDILSSTSFTVQDLVIYPVEYSSFGILDPLLFVELEEKRSLAMEGEEKQCRTERKMIFDSLNECLGLKSSQYFQAGYRSWARGVAAIGDDDLAEEVYRNISEWAIDTIGEWMVDELVERDLSTQSSRWINFETEAFETAIELERGVLNSLIEEMVADIF